MKYGLEEQHLFEIIDIIKSHPNVQEIILFGSRAMGNFRPGSDIDIALKGDQLQLKDVLKMSVEIDDLLILNKVDLVIFHTITETMLKDHINKVGISLWKSPT